MAFKFAEADGVIVFLDALGTKGISARTDPKEYVKSWQKLLDESHKYNEKFHDSPEWSNETSTIQAFSDTIIITAKLTKE